MEEQGYVDLGRVKYQPRGGLDWCERHLGAEQPAVSDSGLTTRFDKYTYGQPDILSPVSKHGVGGAGDMHARRSQGGWDVAARDRESPDRSQ